MSASHKPPEAKRVSTVIDDATDSNVPIDPRVRTRYRRAMREHFRAGSFWLRGSIAVGVIALAAVGAAIVTMPATTRPLDGGATITTRDRDALLALLADLQAAWKPELHRKLVERAVARAGEFEHALHWLLSQPTHRLIEPAIELAGELRLPSTSEDLETLTKHADLRVKALSAIDRIEPLAIERLQEMVQDQNRAVRCVAAHIAGSHRPLAVEPLLKALGDRDPAVRDAACAALPESLPAEAAPAILQLAGDPDPALAVIGLMTLGRLPFTTDIEALLATACRRPETDLALAAMRGLRDKPAPLATETIDQLWAVVGEGRRPLVAAAFAAFEATRSCPPDELRRRLDGLGDAERYFAARLLLTEGDAGGIEVLLALAAAHAEDTDPDGKAIRFAALTLLGSLAKKPASTPLEELRSTLANTPIEGPQRLPAPELDW